jgi:hypothetical protein
VCNLERVGRPEVDPGWRNPQLDVVELEDLQGRRVISDRSVRPLGEDLDIAVE